MKILEYNQLCKKYNLKRYFMREELDTVYVADYTYNGDCICGFRTKYASCVAHRNALCIYENGVAREWAKTAVNAEKLLCKRISEIKRKYKQERINSIIKEIEKLEV